MDYAKRHGHKLPADITPQTPLVAFNLDEWNVNVGIVLIALFLVGIGICIGALNGAVQKKIKESKSSMSKESYRMQKSLTVILLAQVECHPFYPIRTLFQAIIPGISIAIPVLIYCIAIGFSLDDLLQSAIFEWFSVLVIGAYPFFNSSFCIYHMKPYRRFTKVIMRKVFFCCHWSDEVVTIAAPTTTQPFSVKMR